MRIKPIFCLILCVALITSCHKDENESVIIKGSLSINVGLFISVSEVDNNLKSTLGAEDFLVTIYNPVGEEILVFERASEIPAEIELEPGQYYVTAHSNNNLAAAFENPYYFGESPFFSIVGGAHQAVTVNCELANTIVAIVYSDQLRNNYSDFNTTVSTSAGSLVFTREEVRAGYFQPLPINISVLLTWQKEDGTSGNKTLSGTIPDPKPRKKYEIHVDAGSVDGSSSIQINLDENIEPIEIVNITDTDSPGTGIFDPGDILISEIMYDPDSLEDSAGEWFEIYNNTNAPVDIHQLVIRKNGTEQHIVNSSIIIAAHAYYALARTENAFAGIKYVYGSSISLNNTGANLTLYNYGTDGSDGSVICAINYAADEFPTARGASICLSPALLNYTDAQAGDSWCVSVTPYNTEDLGTPGSQNDNCL
jgi:hypothetical protein